MTLDLDQLESAANRMKSARSAVREGAVSIRALNAAKQEYDDASEPDILLALIAEVRALREDKARLDSGCIVTNERDDFGEEYKCERRGNDLRKMIDEAIACRAKEPK